MKEKCICCGKMYLSEGAEIDFAKCFDCNWREDCNLVRNWKKKIKTVTNKKIRPDYLGNDLLHKIRVFFCENNKILWQRKKDCYKIINEQFGLSLSEKQIESIINTVTLKAHNLQVINV